MTNEDKSIEDELFKILRYEWKVKKILALFQMEVECSDCGGIGIWQGDGLDQKTCPKCKGKKTEIVPFKRGVKGVCL